jgi:hypothetical protein
LHQWVDKRGKRIDYHRYYVEWLMRRRTLTDIANILAISVPKISKEFDKIEVAEGVQYPAPASAINLLVDASFFGRNYGYLCFHDCKNVIYFREIKTESVRHLRSGLYELLQSGYRFKSITIDGRTGYYENIRKILGAIPIQMCIFHQKAIIRRYITDRPKSACGQALKALMTTLCHAEPQKFIDDFYALKYEYRHFLNEKYRQDKFVHGNLRAAFKSMQDNLHKLFTYKEIPELNIPPTINHLEGTFSHLKEKISIHRGLCQKRKKNAAKFVLKNS